MASLEFSDLKFYLNGIFGLSSFFFSKLLMLIKLTFPYSLQQPINRSYKFEWYLVDMPQTISYFVHTTIFYIVLQYKN